LFNRTITPERWIGKLRVGNHRWFGEVASTTASYGATVAAFAAGDGEMNVANYRQPAATLGYAASRSLQGGKRRQALVAARLAATLAVLALAEASPALAQRMVGGEAPEGQWSTASCSGHGRIEFGRCACDSYWKGAQCDTPEQPIDCGQHGKSHWGRCVCAAGWKGRTCRTAPSTCAHGSVANGKCVCDPGWSGGACDAAGH
jgi:hypothetical protein